MKALSIGRRFVDFELGELLAPLLERRRAFAGPDHGIERQPRHHLRMPLGEHRRAQRARGNSVNQKGAFAAQFLDVQGGRVAIIGALGYRRIVVAVFGGAAIALHVDTPAVVSAAGEVIHRG